MSASESVGDRYRRLCERLRAACERAARDPDTVTLLGASKRQSVERMRAAWEAGLGTFAENRVQEAEAKIRELPDAASWHLIGPLQSNKARKAVALFDTVHSVDRPKIARILAREAQRAGKRLPAFIEVNLGHEQSKHGFPPEGLAERVRELADLDSLEIVGLMAIPPWESDPERARLWFRRLRELRDEVFARPEWSARPGYLSMGMSGDFETAIEEGATHVRVGTALFGERP